MDQATWHYTDDRKPNEWQLVLGYNHAKEPKHGLCLRFMHSSGEEMWEWNGGCGGPRRALNRPLCWMPLPEPPMV